MSELRGFVTGATGQLGSFMIEYLLAKGYKVYGLVRRSSTENKDNLKDVLGDKDLELVEGDLTDQASLSRVIKIVKPHEVYHFGAMSHVGTSFEQPITTGDITGLGTLRLLEAIRDSNFLSRFANATTSEMFGLAAEVPQTELTPFHPRSPYGCAKVYSYCITKNYRESYNMFASNAIMFNTESERRGLNFVTRKITDGIGKIVAGLATHIELGNLNTKRDWSYAGDMVDGYYKMLHHSQADDFVFASGETHCIEEFLAEAFKYAGLGDWHPYITCNPKFLRPAEVDILQGNSSKARKVLGWNPHVDFKTLVAMMVDFDI